MNRSELLRRSRILLGLSFMAFAGCLGIPDNVEPVSNFDLSKYLGTWYEIARLDHSFERGLTKVTANYSMREDGGVRVLNRGYSAENAKWKEAEGKAYFVGDSHVGYLKVSFFGPFYGSYVILDLDPDYKYSVVCGPNVSYLWILSRTPALDQDVTKRLLAKVKALGFPTDELIFVEQP